MIKCDSAWFGNATKYSAITEVPFEYFFCPDYNSPVMKDELLYLSNTTSEYSELTFLAVACDNTTRVCA